jgi:uncharacterized protein YjbJ (UPF0337 family)
MTAMPRRFLIANESLHRGFEGTQSLQRGTAMNEDRIAGTARNVGGKVQEGFGRVTGDAKSQADGLVNQAAAAAQDFYGQAKETASDAAQVVRQGAIDTEDYVRRIIEQRRFVSAGLSVACDGGIETCR